MNGTINVTFTNPGINFVELNVTTSGPTGNFFGTYEVTIAVGNYSIMKIVPKIAPNRNELIDAAYLPGGPATFDPALTSDVVSQEVTFEIYQGLLMNTNNSINTYVPVIAKNIPSIQNGEEQVSPNGFVNFTFYINTSLQFSNGDHVSPYDVYVSFARDLLFAYDPGSPDWGLASLMLPAPSIFGPFNNSFYWIHRVFSPVFFDHIKLTIIFIFPHLFHLPNFYKNFLECFLQAIYSRMPLQAFASNVLYLSFHDISFYYTSPQILQTC